MDIASHQNCQELACQLYDMLQTNLEPLYKIVYESNTTGATENWNKVLREFPEEIKTMTVTSAFKSNYKKTIGIYLYHVLRKQNVNSVASAQVFLQKFMKNCMRHPRMQAMEGGPSFFTQDNYSSQKMIILDLIRLSVAQTTEEMGLAGGGSNRTEISVISTRLKTTLKNKQKEHERSTRLRRHRSSHSYFEEPSPKRSDENKSVRKSRVTKSTHHSRADATEAPPTKETSTRKINLQSKPMVYTPDLKPNSVVPDDSVSCALAASRHTKA